MNHQKLIQPFNNEWFITIYKSNKSIIYTVAVASIIIFTIIALILPSEYRATVVLFPASNESASFSLFSENINSKGVSRFGEIEEVEYYLQILYSDQLKDYIVKRFHLYEHYGIDTTEKYPKTKLSRKWKNNISFRKTEFLSIEIEVFDKDPVYAANIANTIADYSDSLYNKIKQERAKKAFEIVKTEYENAVKQIEEMQDSLAKLRKLGLLNYKDQTEKYTEAYAQALAKGNKEGARAIEEKMNIFAQYGGIYQTYEEILTNEALRISNLRQKYMEAKVDAEHFIPYKFIVSRAEVPEKEYYPIRWLIILSGVLSTMVFTLFILAFYQKKSLSNNENE